MEENVLTENIPAPFSKGKQSTSWRSEKDTINKKSTDINSLPSSLLSEIAKHLPNQDKINFALAGKKYDKAVYKNQNWSILFQNIINELQKIYDFSFEHRASKYREKERFNLFIKLLCDYHNNKLMSSREKDIGQQRTIFIKGMVSLITSPETFKKSTTWGFWRYCCKQYLWLDDVQALITQYVIHKNAENLLQHGSSSKLGVTIQAYTNYLRKYRHYNDNSAFIYGSTLNKIQTAILTFQRKENKTTSQTKKAIYARQLSQRIRSISNALNRSSHFWARLSPRLCLFFGLIVFGLGLLLLASSIAATIAAWSASAMIAMVVIKIAAFFKLTADSFLALTIASGGLLALPVLAGGMALFSQYYNSHCYYSKMAPEVNSIADVAEEMAISMNKIN